MSPSDDALATGDRLSLARFRGSYVRIEEPESLQSIIRSCGLSLSPSLSSSQSARTPARAPRTRARASPSTDRTDRGSCSRALFGLGASEMRSTWSPSARRTSRGGSSASRGRRSSHGAPSSSRGSAREASHSSSSMRERETRRRSRPRDLMATSYFDERRVIAAARWRSRCPLSSPASSPMAGRSEHPGS